MFTEIELDKHDNALIVGENGAGKTTFLDAICFSLFNKAFRKINKNRLINSVNGKDCVVEIEFTTNGKHYKVVRGIKPNVFEVFVDGDLIKQDSVKDYQEHLETHILKMDYKTFTQIDILGSSSFTPFMKLSAADRRQFIEDLLDIQIFSTMNNINKVRAQVNRENIEKNRIKISSVQNMISYIENTIVGLKQNSIDRSVQIDNEIEEHEAVLSELTEKYGDLVGDRDDLLDKADKHKDYTRKLKEVDQLISRISTKVQINQESLSFYEENTNCPTCKQDLNSQHKESMCTTATQSLDDLSNALNELEAKKVSFTNKIEVCEALLEEASEIDKKIIAVNTKMVGVKETIKKLRKSKENLDDSDTLLKEAEGNLKTTCQEYDQLIEEKEQLFDEKQILEIAATLLKDDGIKSKIIGQYLPIMNKLINKYLSQMGFFVDFHIDDNFEETIKSRYRDTFEYNNFSEGEKFRIDLALLMTWRAIAKMKNSASTNILIFDEVFDSSLDLNGTDEFIKIMWSLAGSTNVFIISHKQDQLTDKFKKIYRFQKQGNFSRLI